MKNFVALLFILGVAHAQTSTREFACQTLDGNFALNADGTLDLGSITELESRTYDLPPSANARTLTFSMATFSLDRIQIFLNGQEIGDKNFGFNCGNPDIPFLPPVSCFRGPAKWSLKPGAYNYVYNEYALTIQNQLDANGYPNQFNEAVLVNSSAASADKKYSAVLVELTLPPSNSSCQQLEFRFSNATEFPTFRNYILHCPDFECPEEIHFIQQNVQCGRQFKVCGMPTSTVWKDEDEEFWKNRRFTASQTGTYQVSASFAGCPTISKTFHVDIPTPNAIQTPAMDVTQIQFLCVGSEMTFHPTTTNINTGSRFRWFKATTNSEPLVDLSYSPHWSKVIASDADFGIYKVEAIDPKGCHAIATLDVQPGKAPSIQGAGSFCEGDHGYIVTEPTLNQLKETYPWTAPKYQWKNLRTGNASGDHYFFYDFHQPPDAYQLRITFENSPCVVENNFSFQFSPMSLDAEVRDAKCENGGQIDLKVSAPVGNVSYEIYERNAMFNWEKATQYGSGPTFKGLHPDNWYRLSATDALGCTRWTDQFVTGDLHSLVLQLPTTCDDSAVNLQLKNSKGNVVLSKKEFLHDIDLGTMKVFTLEEGGCTFEIEKDIPKNVSAKIYVPNAFSPNGDGTNDVFKPMNDGRPDLLIKSFSIYNSQGHLIHSESNKELGDILGWNGVIKGNAASPGVYAYAIDYSTDECPKNKLVGTVTILK